MAAHIALGKKPTSSSLVPRSHDPKDIVKAIVSPIKGSKRRWLLEKDEQVKELRSWLDRFARDIASARTNNTTLDRLLLVNCLVLVSDLFLLGALANVRIAWENNFPIFINGTTSRNGRLIRLNMTKAYNGNITPERCAVRVLGTIVHEALHALSLQFACREHDACLEAAGASGHGSAWQEMAFEVEKALQYAGFESITLARGTAAQNEWHTLDLRGVVWSLSKEEVLRWFGGVCPITGKVYPAGWREKVKALVRWPGKLIK